MNYDAIFVGAGISCLYAAYKYKLKYPDRKFVILEKSVHIGGRVDWDTFEGIEVTKGAGIVREKDKLLLELLDELNVTYTASKRKLGNLSVKLNIDKLTENIALIKQGETFKDFAIRILGDNVYQKFKIEVGYTDYENYDVQVALKYYGFDDVYGSRTIFRYKWSELIKAIVSKIGNNNIHICENVIKVKTNSVTVEKLNKKQVVYNAPIIYVGTTINVLRKLFPTINAYRYIESQPFIRIYVKLNKHLDISDNYHTDSPLQKMFNISDNIYMIYADNVNALYLKNLKKNELLHTLRLEFNDSEIKILKYVKYFWKHGTHYYKPLSQDLGLDALLEQAKNPGAGIHVIGEVVAYNQGWIGSTLKTVKI